jgi:hypothetical protein
VLRTPDAVIRTPPHTDRACSGCQSPGNGACPHGEIRFKRHRSRTGRFTSAARHYAALTRILVAAANQTFGAANIAACTISRRFAIPASPHPGLIAESSHFSLPTSHFPLPTSQSVPNPFPNASAVHFARGLPSGGSEGHFPSVQHWKLNPPASSVRLKNLGMAFTGGLTSPARLPSSHFSLLTSHFSLPSSPMRSQTRLQCS